mgnify:CR=1 FL=1
MDVYAIKAIYSFEMARWWRTVRSARFGNDVLLELARTNRSISRLTESSAIVSKPNARRLVFPVQ